MAITHVGSFDVYVGPNCHTKVSQCLAITAGGTCDITSLHSSAQFCNFTDPTSKAARMALYWRMRGVGLGVASSPPPPID